MKDTLLRICATGLLLLSPAIASAAEGYSTANVNMRAGPSTSYPAVAVIPLGESVEIHGCLADVPWCDVEFYGGRGWVAGRYVQAVYQSRRVYVGPEYYRPLGIPTVVFSVGNYWDRYYRNRDFYRDRDRWRRGPDFYRPPPRDINRPDLDRRQDADGRRGFDRRPDLGLTPDADRRTDFDRDQRRQFDFNRDRDNRRPDANGDENRRPQFDRRPDFRRDGDDNSNRDRRDFRRRGGDDSNNGDIRRRGDNDGAGNDRRRPRGACDPGDPNCNN
ncbi:SH3 domain-containing protein [Rhizobium sp. YAF28]|uniref:SH3 domain-containing protein n=1 Tax=Rhizobium sp. YAF28 TaxID=3233081 RepID=UPI000DDD9B11